jgi:hypothetical protein
MSSNGFRFQFPWLGFGSETIAVSTFRVLSPGSSNACHPKLRATRLTGTPYGTFPASNLQDRVRCKDAGSDQVGFSLAL